MPMNDKYLRNRPFLLVNMVQRPAEDTRTYKKGWQEIKGAMKTFEQRKIVDRVNSTQLQSANVIIDIVNAKCIKNSFSEDNDKEVVNHYLEKYKTEITQAIEAWASRIAERMPTLQPSTESSVIDAVYTTVENQDKS